MLLKWRVESRTRRTTVKKMYSISVEVGKGTRGESK